VMGSAHACCCLVGKSGERFLLFFPPPVGICTASIYHTSHFAVGVRRITQPAAADHRNRALKSRACNPMVLPRLLSLQPPADHADAVPESERLYDPYRRRGTATSTF